MRPELSIEYSDALESAFRDLRGTDALVQPEVDFSSSEYQALLARFKVYQKQDLRPQPLPPLRLYTCYRGVPFDSPVEVVSVDEEFVELRVTRRQAKVLAGRGFAMVESPIHGTAFRAFTSDVDEQACCASFSHFVPHYDLSDLRTHMRVEPRVSIPVTLSRETVTITGHLSDMSELAMAIRFREIGATGLTEGMATNIAITLPLVTGDCAVQTTGIIAKVAPNVFGSFSEQRVIVQMSPDPSVKEVFIQYIAQRQEEVYAELGSE